MAVVGSGAVVTADVAGDGFEEGDVVAGGTLEDDDVVAPAEPLGGDDRLWVGPQLVRAAEATSTSTP